MGPIPTKSYSWELEIMGKTEWWFSQLRFDREHLKVKIQRRIMSPGYQLL